MASSVCQTTPLANALLPEGFCAGMIPVEASVVRSVVAVPSVSESDFLMLERGTASVVAVRDSDGDGIPDLRQTVVTLEGLNHGIAFSDTYLYASTPDQVWRWPWDDMSALTVQQDAGELLIENVSDGATGRHPTRTLALDPETRETTLYVSVGSRGNIDEGSFRARIRRFDITDPTQFPFLFENGEVFADGIRNEVAMEFDAAGVLWGVGNSGDLLSREDLDVGVPFTFMVEDNPAEEVHRFDVAGQNYGYPFCWREFRLEPEVALGAGTAWAWFLDGPRTDAQCRTEFDNPIQVLQAHSSPLGITFYQYPTELCEGVEPFPQEMEGYAFVAYHGSWNRNVPTGYKVVYMPVTTSESGQVTVGEPVDLLRHETDRARWPSGLRPVDVSFDRCGRLLVSSDGTIGVKERTGEMMVRIERGESIMPSPPSTSDSPRFCFPGSSRVTMADGYSTKRLDELKVGDQVLSVTQETTTTAESGGESVTTTTSSAEVVYLPHLPNEVETEYLEFECVSSLSNQGGQDDKSSSESGVLDKLRATASHYVYILPTSDSAEEDEQQQAQPIPAEDVQVGDLLWKTTLSSTNNNNNDMMTTAPCRVVSIEPVMDASGYHTAFTTTGTLVVDGFVVSSYAGLTEGYFANLGHDLSHEAAAVLRWAHQCGVSDTTLLRQLVDSTAELVA